MRLRHVLLLASGAGAAGALLLAADIHRRVQEAQREMVVNTTVPGNDSVLHFGDAHMLGLLALAFLFIAFFLLIFSEPLRQNAAAKSATTTTPVPPPAPVAEPAPPRIEVTTVPAVPIPEVVVASEVNPAETVPAAATPMTDAPPPISTPHTPSAPVQPSVSNDASAASGVSDSESSKAHER